MTLKVSISFFVIFVISQCSGTIYFLDKNGNYTLSIDDEPSLFGPGMSTDIEGYLTLAQPLNACQKLKPPKDKKSDYIAIAERGNCSFTEKVLNAQEHFIALIVYDNVNERIIPMDGESDEISIPSVFITLSASKLIFSQHAIGNYTIIKPGSPSYLLLYLIPFILFLLLILIALVVFLVYRIYVNYRASRKLALSRSQLRKLKKIIFKKGQSNYETCAICIDDYVNGEKLRVLPCNHAYHCKCIDKWLLKRRRVCPICKHVIRFPGEVIDSDIEQEGSSQLPTGAANTSQVLIQNESSSSDFPTVAISQPRRKRHHPSTQPQASTSLEQPASTSMTTASDSDSDGTVEEANNSTFFDRLKRRFTPGKSSHSRHEDRAPLVHQSDEDSSSNSTSGHNTPPLERVNLGFDVQVEKPANAEPADGDSTNTRQV